MNRYWKSFGIYALMFCIVLGILAMVNGSINSSPPAQMAVSYDYGDLVQQIEDGQVATITILKSGGANDFGQVEVTTKDGQTYTTNVVGWNQFMEFLTPHLLSGEIEQTDVADMPENNILVSILPSIIFMIIAIIIFTVMFQKMQGGGGKMANFGKSKAKVTIDDKNRVTFDNVAGLDEEKAELQEIVEFLRDPKKFVDLGARIPKGVLLVGPPGTGKTLLAKAVAGEAKVPFFSISGSDFVEMFVGVGASRVRDLFDQAKKNAPCIVFIDEIDAVGRRRGAGLGGGHDEREQTLNQL